MKKIFHIFALFSLLFLSSEAYGTFVIPPAPATPVLDEVGILSAEEKTTIEQTIYDLENETHHQIGIAIIADLQGNAVDEAAVAVARGWGIGRKGLDNGLLILIAPNEREMWIEVGRGLEGVMTDLMSKRIFEENFVPQFREGNYFAGIKSGLDRIAPVIRGEVVDLPENPVSGSGIAVTLLFWIIWGGFFMGSFLFAPTKSWWLGIVLGSLITGIGVFVTTHILWTAIISSIFGGGLGGVIDWAFSSGKIKPHMGGRGGRWGGGGGSGGSGGGGWGGFGGGGFGGGGAGGKW